MNKKNYQLELDAELERIKELPEPPSLLLHSCCGPCSSYVLEYLAEYFDLTLMYFNPCIYPQEEYERRLCEQRRILALLPQARGVTLLEAQYDHASFLQAVAGLEDEPEGSRRCERCFCQRLEMTAHTAALRGFDYFATTLSVSPHKNTQLLNELGERAGMRFGVRHLPADFKKRDGYKRSTQLSRQYGLYRQSYCGCEFSLAPDGQRSARE